MPPAKLNILASAEKQITETFSPHIVGDVNDYQVKVAKFGDVFDWHAHENEDEAFLVLKGRIAIDFRDGTMEHRPRSLTSEPVVLMFEPATTLNTGNAESDLTVNELKRLN